MKHVSKLEGGNYHKELEAITLFSHSKVYTKLSFIISIRFSGTLVLILAQFKDLFVKSFVRYDDENSIYTTMEVLLTVICTSFSVIDC